MVEVGDEVYSLIFPEECNTGTVISKESEIISKQIDELDFE